MRYLVTGGAAIIGSNTVDELVRRSHEVAGLDDLSTGKAGNLANVRTKNKLIRESITHLDSVREAGCGLGRVIHLAARTSVPRSVKDPIETNLINVNVNACGMSCWRRARPDGKVMSGLLPILQLSIKTHLSSISPD